MLALFLLFVGASIDLKTVKGSKLTNIFQNTVLLPLVSLLLNLWATTNFECMHFPSLGITFYNVNCTLVLLLSTWDSDEQGTAAVCLLLRVLQLRFALGAAIVAAISPTALAGTLLPLVGVVLGNLSPFIRGFWFHGINLYCCC